MTGLILLIQTFLICLISGIILKSFWFSYIIFLIFLGGLLILFSYILSLASNEIFKFSRFIFFKRIFLWNTLLLLFLLIDKIFFILNKNTLNSSSIYSIENFYLENSLILNKLFNYPINLISLILIIYLFNLNCNC